jgi:hypothetical protein
MVLLGSTAVYGTAWQHAAILAIAVLGRVLPEGPKVKRVFVLGGETLPGAGGERRSLVESLVLSGRAATEFFGPSEARAR